MKIRNPGAATRAGTKKTALFDIVNRKRRGAMHRQGAEAPSRQRQRARVLAEGVPRRAFAHEFRPARSGRARRETRGGGVPMTRCEERRVGKEGRSWWQ